MDYGGPQKILNKEAPSSVELFVTIYERKLVIRSIQVEFISTVGFLAQIISGLK